MNNEFIKRLISEINEIAVESLNIVKDDVTFLYDLKVAETEDLIAKNANLKYQVDLFRGIFESLKIPATEKAKLLMKERTRLAEMREIEDMYYAS